MLMGNSATYGGGTAAGLLNNCLLSGNAASDAGGATAFEATLNNCTLAGNYAPSGGGAFKGTLNNCIVYYNTATNGANYYGNQFDLLVLNHTCTIPLPPAGIGNITNTPLFMDQAIGNFRLQSNSPCINAGSSVFAPDDPDLDGKPRIVGGMVDIGAYEFQTPASVISYAWLQQYSFPTDGSADFTDPDADRLNNWQEWRAGTEPTNSSSVLRMLTPATGASGMVLKWESVIGRAYFVEGVSDLGALPAFETLATNVVAQTNTTTYIDTNAAGGRPFFYRVGVRE
jgi:hypothetical protein